MGINFFNRDIMDSKFLLFEHLKVDRLLEYDAFKDFTIEDLNMIIDEALKISRDVLAPTLQESDRKGCIYEDGKVKFPQELRDAWKVLAENGWIGVANSSEFGGQGLPESVSAVVSELFNSGNAALAIGAQLTVGAGRLIENFGTDDVKKIFVEKMYTGQWGGTMALTEPDAGSDVGNTKTKAIPEKDSHVTGIYRIEGNKQYITCAEHDLTENIINLILARIQGAPEGTRGLSLFIVPKIWVNPDGSLGEPNDILCTGIEHKMGQHASATCSLALGPNGGCRGILLGSEKGGIARMFQMMNELRLHSGLQGLALAASAYDVARKYAKERIQGKAFTNPKGGRVPIIKHEDVRRMLMNLKSGTEAMRAMIMQAFYFTDQAKHDPVEENRNKAQGFLEFYIPVVKLCGADFSYELIRDAIQVLGGAGYCRDFPVEQYARDCKVLSIVEGTSFMQARDLVIRKLGLGDNRDGVFREIIHETCTLCEINKKDPELGVDFEILSEAAGAMDWIVSKLEEYFVGGSPELVLFYATRVTENLGKLIMARLILEQALIAKEKLRDCDPAGSKGGFYKGKTKTAQFFVRNILPAVFALKSSMMVEDRSALEIGEEAF
ncbi:MAG: acyl-CoA dehydrogenase [Deltaproteobacteria bacterium]|nr:acyl-CoA dehydrogenase [Deltaproteobacteria bacterium]